MDNIDLTEIPRCTECDTLLGNIPHNSKTAQWFFTISPPMITTKHNYGDMYPEKQKRFIRYHFSQALMNVKKKIRIYNYSMHYELTKHEQLHAHGILTVHLDDMMRTNQITLSKALHNQYGVKGLSACISSRIELIKDYDKVVKYINKENIYPPEHVTSKQNIEYFLS